MDTKRIKEMVSDNKQVHFVKYFDGDLWYSTEDGFQFPVPVKDIGTATFLAQDKAILFMRYIRKYIELLVSYKIPEKNCDCEQNDPYCVKCWGF